MELVVDGKDYEKQVEKEVGLLSFQGKRYKSFERQN